MYQRNLPMLERNLLIKLGETILNTQQRFNLLSNETYQRYLDQVDPESPHYLHIHHKRIAALIAGLGLIYAEIKPQTPAGDPLDADAPLVPTADRIFDAAAAIHQIQPGLIYALVQLKQPDNEHWVLELICENLALANAIAAYTHTHCGQIPTLFPRKSQNYCVQIHLANANPLHFTAVWEPDLGPAGFAAFRQLLTQLQVDQSKLPFPERL